MQSSKRSRETRTTAPEYLHHPLVMSKTTAGMENIYFEMESKQVTDAGTYDKVAGESVFPATKQSTLETQEVEKIINRTSFFPHIRCGDRCNSANATRYNCTCSCILPDRCSHFGFGFSDDEVSKRSDCFNRVWQAG